MELADIEKITPRVAPIKPPLNLSAWSPIYLNIFVLDKIER